MYTEYTTKVMNSFKLFYKRHLSPIFSFSNTSFAIIYSYNLYLLKYICNMQDLLVYT